MTAHPGYSGSLATYVLALVNLYGWDYFKEFRTEEIKRRFVEFFGA
ncbi:MAG: hypothetical protein ACM37Z_17890 [Deltaproteobacteria bacterium]